MKKRLPIYTCMHFLVDLTCIYRLYAWIMPQSGTMENWILLVVLYNFLAFALPGLVGLIADLRDSSDGLAAAGCILAAVPFWIPASFGWTVWGTVILQGVGNGFFHVGAGRKVLLESQGKYAPAGIFISSGAMGVFLGTLWKHSFRSALMLGLALSLMICALILYAFSRGKMQAEEKHDHSVKAGTTQSYKAGDRGGRITERNADDKVPANSAESHDVHFLSIPVLMILLVVILRSYYGTAVSYAWKNTVLISFLFASCIVAGKALGGIVADRIGVRWTAVLSVGGAAVTVMFSEHSPLLGCLSILLFNMTMPLTLSLIANYWKGYPGFAFGMLMLALFIGTIPDLVEGTTDLSMPGLCAVSLISLVGLLIGIGREHKERLP